MLSSLQPQVSDSTSVIDGMIRSKVGKFMYEKHLSRQAFSSLAETGFLLQRAFISHYNSHILLKAYDPRALPLITASL